MNFSPINPCRRASVALLLLIVTPLARATGQEAIGGPVPVGSAEVLSVLGGLFSVIAAILVVGFLYARLKGPRIGGNDIINIVASQALGPKERIVLIQIAETQLVVGMTTSSVRTLHVFDEPAVKIAQPGTSSGFAERFRHALKGERK